MLKRPNSASMNKVKAAVEPPNNGFALHIVFADRVVLFVSTIPITLMAGGKHVFAWLEEPCQQKQRKYVRQINNLKCLFRLFCQWPHRSFSFLVSVNRPHQYKAIGCDGQRRPKNRFFFPFRKAIQKAFGTSKTPKRNPCPARCPVCMLLEFHLLKRPALCRKSNQSPNFC